MTPRGASSVLLLSLLAVGPVDAQGVRSHTRPTNTGTNVTKSQAVDLTLTLAEASVRPVQTWVRTGASIDKTRKILTAYLYPPESGLVMVGQRARAFPPESKSSMYQAKITRVATQGGRTLVQAMFAARGREESATYVLEIVAEQGPFLSIPNEAIIEEGDKHIAYVQKDPGHYVPQEVHLGVQGELYTQVVDGLKEGDQVVTFGSFFIDAEYKLKATDQGAMSK